ncbi:hydrolase [Acanthamoeba castellanii str. Neff]|uniref:Hydrolase n=1 Tax=Acanthamoeba castellanii (strain ATCC 30010 / Neff) TaxID=1257118 RepID=L8H7F5_ACACF|nr:hydrolase [Acanthamoeba castellanii str. Neff]ELR20416.1 hydrolase [Acanthamoeba castellanii str. Neff]
MEQEQLKVEDGWVPCRTLQLIDAPADALATPAPNHKLAYRDWKPSKVGAEPAPVVFAVHGLTRNSRDFDTVAEALVKDGYRVIAVDMPGRWNSGQPSLHSPHERVPAANYSYPQYIHDIRTLAHHLGLTKIDWLGTSMGGMIGMLLAAQHDSQDVHPVEIGRFIMNDIGPFVPATGLHRLGKYVGKESKFRSMDDVRAYVKRIAQQFGCHTEEEWEKITKYYVRPVMGGGEYEYELHYDPAIASSIPSDPAQFTDIDLWKFWEHVKCDSLLLLRGADSDILPKAVAEEMVKRARFPVRIHEFAGVGHAPALVTDDQIQVVRHFFLEGPAAE